jgi:hypothetical protein
LLIPASGLTTLTDNPPHKPIALTNSSPPNRSRSATLSSPKSSKGFAKTPTTTGPVHLLTNLTVFNFLEADLAIKSADNFRTLRKQGITVRKTIDVIIATFCIENNHELLFGDRDFLPFVDRLGLKSVL